MSNRKIKLYLSIGMNVSQVDFEDLPDDWDEMSKEQKDKYLEEASDAFNGNHIDCGACVVDEKGEPVDD